jgi:hypothetical protein
LLGKVFRENKKLNLELENAFSEISSLRSAHDDMSTKPCDNCKMIMVNYVNLWLMHSHVASLLDGARLELRELKAHSTLLGVCTSCLLLRSNLEAAAIEIKDLKHKLDHPSRYTILSPPCEACVSLKGKLFHATKENTQLQQEVTYLTARLEKTILSEKMIEEDLSWVEESATKSTYKLGVGFERCEDKDEKSAPKFIPSSSYHREEETLKPTKAHACFVAVWVTWMSFASDGRELRGDVLNMLETHIMMSSLIFRLILILVFRLARTLMFRLALFHMLCLAALLVLRLSSLMDLTIAHMGLVYERTALCLDALDMAHVLIMVIVSYVGLVSLLEGLTLTLSRDIWMDHVFPVMVHAPLDQMVSWKGL